MVQSLNLRSGKRVHEQTTCGHERDRGPRDMVLSWAWLHPTAGIVSIQVVSFSIHWWMGMLSVLMTFFLAIVACRATGETDITPIGAMGKITQLFYGVIAPANITTNLMTACVTAGAAASSADLLDGPEIRLPPGGQSPQAVHRPVSGDLRRRHRHRPGFLSDRSYTGCPGRRQVSRPGGTGLERGGGASGPRTIQPRHHGAMGAGHRRSVGILIPILERLFRQSSRPSSLRPWGSGLAFVIPFWNTLSIFMGALIAWVLSKSAKDLAAQYTIPVASGMIAGESLMGVMIALLGMLGIME